MPCKPSRTTRAGCARSAGAHARWTILLFGDQVLDEPRLKVPHYHMHARPFVLYPLAELVPGDFRLADGRALAQLLEACPFIGLERL